MKYVLVFWLDTAGLINIDEDVPLLYVFKKGGSKSIESMSVHRLLLIIPGVHVLC